MRKILLLLISSIFIAQSAVLKNIEVFKQDKNLDVLLLLDETFDSRVQFFLLDNQKIIVFKNISFGEKWEKTFKSSVLNSINIFSKNDNLYLVPKGNDGFEIQAAKSKNGKILRVRFLPQDSIDHINVLMHRVPEVKLTQAAKDSKKYFIKDNYQYWLVLGVMAFLIIMLLIVRKKFNLKYFDNHKSNVNDFQIISSKNIDSNNKIVLLQKQNYQYILLLGNRQNIMIDKISLDNVESDKNFYVDLLESFEEKQGFKPKNAR
ncbi:hypothetical protein [Helicobacter sp. 13S00477-4]|uniref:hypothetical protein n=1 Tax=Helicobacter sp. 13S00477-4 TaxID=1905759 RepID=UPI000BA51916|nr:hypothetical protein [Helicobacter sp. 13S00477-4]PAF51247.1 hypothetical protein BKH44_05945 [Helicobacter sp. 13S00477-4]